MEQLSYSAKNATIWHDTDLSLFWEMDNALSDFLPIRYIGIGDETLLFDTFPSQIVVEK